MARKFTKYPSNYVKADTSYNMDDTSGIRLVCDDKKTYPRQLTAKVMTDLLTNSDVTTYKMFEELGRRYLAADAQMRKGMDYACIILTYKSVPEIASEIMGAVSGEDSPNAFGRFD